MKNGRNPMNVSLSDFATELVANNNYCKVGIGGFSGSGKTRTVSEIVKGCYKQIGLKKPVLILDNEKGGRFLIPFFNKVSIPVLLKETVHLADVITAFDFLEKGEIDFLLIDSLSKIWYQYVRDYRKANRKKFMTLQDWGKILPSWQEEFADRFVEVEGNIAFTGRGGFSYEKEDDEVDDNGKKTKGQFVKSGVKMKLAGETPFEPDLNIWMMLQQDIKTNGKLHQWREAQVLKDRSGTIDGKTFKNPTYENFKPFFDLLLGLPTGDVAKETYTENLAPSEDYTRIDKRNQKEIELEKIKAIFDKMGLGASKDDKAIKVEIAEKILGTPSWKELTTKFADELTDLREHMEAFWRGWELTEEDKRGDYIKNYKQPGTAIEEELPY